MLYATVHLKSSRQCRITLGVLLQRPDITRYIRQLMVSPNYYLAWPRPDEALDESWVVDKIERMSNDLHALRTFFWDGREMPSDHLWLTLRTSCV